MKFVDWLVVRDDAGRPEKHIARLEHDYLLTVRLEGHTNWVWLMTKSTGETITQGRERSLMMAKLAAHGCARDWNLERTK